MTALVLDDQGTYIRALERALRGGWVITGVETQAAARAAVRPEIPVALVDICLDAADSANREGIEFIRWLRAERPEIKIIAMSARDEQELPRLAKEAGADLFLSKPLRVSELKDVLTKLTGGLG